MSLLLSYIRTTWTKCTWAAKYWQITTKLIDHKWSKGVGIDFSGPSLELKESSFTNQTVCFPSTRPNYGKFDQSFIHQNKFHCKLHTTRVHGTRLKVRPACKDSSKDCIWNCVLKQYMHDTIYKLDTFCCNHCSPSYKTL